MPQQHTNGREKQPDERPQDQLDLWQDVVRSDAPDPFLNEQNLGLGNYQNKEMWQQVESYRNGMYAGAAFRRLLKERAEKETKTALAIDGWSFTDPQDGTLTEFAGWDELTDAERERVWRDELQQHESDPPDRRRWIERRGEQVFERLRQHRRPDIGHYPARDALVELSSYDPGWEPAHNRMLLARHETSRSRGARLLDNVFQRVKERLTNNDGPRRQRER